MTTGPRKTHDFCWLNLMTPKANAARDFFAGLLGWTYGEMPGVPGGSLILVDGLAAGAMMDLDANVMPPGTPPVIGAMVRVDDAAATVAKAVALGGQGDPPMTVMENGRMALVTDPCGAMIGLWEPLSKHGFDCDGRAHGAPTWFETLTSDDAKAVAFYGALFGWTAKAEHPAPGMTYHLLSLDGAPVAGAMRIAPPMPPVPSHWATTFAVRGIDEVAARCARLGGELCMPVHGLDGVGRFALLKSPQGVSFSVMEWA